MPIFDMHSSIDDQRAPPVGQTLARGGRITEDYAALICLYLVNLGAEPPSPQRLAARPLCRNRHRRLSLPSAAGLLMAGARSEECGGGGARKEGVPIVL